jgi:hypothetical protein
MKTIQTGKGLYGASSFLGKVVASIITIIVVIVGIVLIAAGAGTMKAKKQLSEIAEAKVVSQSCFDEKNKNANTHCTTKVEYSVNGKKIVSSITTFTQHSKDDVIQIQYNPKNPYEIAEAGSVSKKSGVVFIIIGLLLIILSIIFLILTFMFKGLAAFIGAIFAFEWLFG